MYWNDPNLPSLSRMSRQQGEGNMIVWAALGPTERQK